MENFYDDLIVINLYLSGFFWCNKNTITKSKCDLMFCCAETDDPIKLEDLALKYFHFSHPQIPKQFNLFLMANNLGT